MRSIVIPFLMVVTLVGLAGCKVTKKECEALKPQRYDRLEQVHYCAGDYSFRYLMVNEHFSRAMTFEGISTRRGDFNYSYRVHEDVPRGEPNWAQMTPRGWIKGCHERCGATVDIHVSSTADILQDCPAGMGLEDKHP